VTEPAGARTEIRTLTLPFDSLRTIHVGASEVRLYRNEITGELEVGKRIDLLGMDKAVVALEAKLLKTIRHDNVAPVTEVAIVQSYKPPLKVIEMVMPYYERGSICDAMRSGERFSLAEARKLAIEALRGAAEINERHQILHRDHKSPNVFLDDDGHARVGDLGIAIPMEDDGSAEAYPSLQLFTPPETYTTMRVDRRSEIYQLGLVAFELINGPFPYADYPQDDTKARLEKGRRALRDGDLEFQPYVPRRMRTVISKAIKVKPGHRFANAMKMIDALRAVKMIDWRETVSEDERVVWDGTSVQRPDRSYRVEATKRRRGGWSLAGSQCVTRHQRVRPDQIVADPRGRDAAAFFESILAASLKT
jgi:eukaryotic-like serine/threonine-protein kinase